MDALRSDNLEVSTSSAGGVNVEHARSMVKLALSHEPRPETGTSGAVVIESPVRERETGQLIDTAKRDRVQKAQIKVEAAYPTVSQSRPLSLEDLLPE